MPRKASRLQTNVSTPCPNKKGATDFLTITFTMCTDLHDFRYATLHLNTNHILANLLRYVSRTSLTWWRNVDVNEIMLFTDKDKHFTLLQRETLEFIPHRCGHRIRRIWIWWTTASGVSFKRVSIPFVDPWCEWVVRTTADGVEAAGPLRHYSNDCAVAQLFERMCLCHHHHHHHHPRISARHKFTKISGPLCVT